MYQSDYCITLDELPATSASDWATYNGGEVKPTEPTEPTEPTNPTDPTDEPTNPSIGFIPGDVTDDGKINVFDNIALKRELINGVDPILRASASDVNGDGMIQLDDLVLLNKFLLGKDVTFSVYTAK